MKLQHAKMTFGVVGSLPSQHRVSDHYRPTSETQCEVRLAYGPIVARLYTNVSILSGEQDIGNPGPEVIKLFSCSTQLSMKFIMVINVKMPTIVGILIFKSMINTPEFLKA